MKEVVFLKNGDKYDKVEISNISYVEADGSYSKVVTRVSVYSITVNLQTVHKKINHPLFIRVHRSFIVNINSITGFDSHHLFINDITIPYSKTHKEELMSHLHKL
jgi:DNA-binding LytR/AlgR family response regulator